MRDENSTRLKHKANNRTRSILQSDFIFFPFSVSNFPRKPSFMLVTQFCDKVIAITDILAGTYISPKSKNSLAGGMLLSTVFMLVSKFAQISSLNSLSYGVPPMAFDT